MRYGEHPAAFVLSQRSSSGTIETGGTVERDEVAVPELADYVSERATANRDREVTGAEDVLPRKLLQSGLALIDSPGVGGLTSAHALTTLAAFPSRTPCSSSRTPRRSIPSPRSSSSAMRCDLAECRMRAHKTDLYPQWRQVEALNRAHLAEDRP